MAQGSRSSRWFHQFRRTFAFLRAHRGRLIIGLTAALGVSAFYTVSLSSVVPLLKVIFADHESLADWVHRFQAERRLSARLPADVPDDPSGLLIETVRPDSPAAGALDDHDRIIAVDGDAVSSYELMRRIAGAPNAVLRRVAVISYDAGRQEVRRELDLPLHEHQAWMSAMRWAATWLPAGRDVDSRLRTLGVVMLALIVMTLLGGLCRLANEGLVASAVQRAMHDLRSTLAEHVLRLPMDWHGRQPPGDTLGRFATDISKVEVGQMTLLGKSIREPLKAVGVIGLTAMIDWRLLIVALIGLPVGAIVLGLFGRLIKRAQKRASVSWGVLLDHLGERLGGIRVVKAYGMQQEEARRFDAEGRTLTRAQTQIEIVDAATNPALELLAVIGVAAFAMYGGARVFRGEIEPHLFFAATVCLGGIFDPVRKLGNVNNRLQAAEVSATRLYELLDTPTEEPDRVGGVQLPPLRDCIEFRGVSFSYPSHADKRVLSDVSLTIRRGECVALVGPNGSGKTTLAALLMRFYHPTSGAILLDCVDIETASLESLRAQIGLVTQDAVVFSDSIRGNIAYGANGLATPERVETAARRAHADEFIRRLTSTESGTQRSGYDAVVPARQLSGGQRQRIALARAILRDPPILILDEATSQIDAESEAQIQQALEDVTRDRTTIIIAHRYSTISRADRVIVLNEGRVIASGAHAELLAANPFYASLCQTQFGAGV